jgi:hypothetical protein
MVGWQNLREIVVSAHQRSKKNSGRIVVYQDADLGEHDTAVSGALLPLFLGFHGTALCAVKA